jgi:hypothetical protein
MTEAVLEAYFEQATFIGLEPQQIASTTEVPVEAA